MIIVDVIRKCHTTIVTICQISNVYTELNQQLTYVKNVCVDQNFLLIALAESYSKSLWVLIYFNMRWSVAPEHNTMTLDNSKAIVLKVATLDTHLHCLTNPVNLKME